MGVGFLKAEEPASWTWRCAGRESYRCLRAPCLKSALLDKTVSFSYSLHNIVTLQRITKILMDRVNYSSKRRTGGRKIALVVLTSDISLVF